MFLLGILAAFGAIVCLAVDSRRHRSPHVERRHPWALLLAATSLTVASVFLLGGSS